MGVGLVTGASGFIGFHVVGELLRKKIPVRVFLRRQDPRLSPPDVELAYGDLLHPESIEKALEGCRWLIHVAGLVSTRAKDSQRLFEVNDAGTLNVFKACKKMGIEKVVYTSTTSCIGASRTPLDESADYNTGNLKVAYIDSKRKGFEAALDFYRQGLPVVILSPTFTLGEGDFQMSASRLVHEFLRGRVLAYTEGGLNVVDVRDVAAAHVAALEKGRNGEVYIIGSKNNLTFKDFFAHLERLSGIRAPWLKAPATLAVALGTLFEKINPLSELNRASALLGRRYWYFDNSKMERELNIQPRPLEETLQDSISFLKAKSDGDSLAFLR